MPRQAPSAAETAASSSSSPCAERPRLCLLSDLLGEWQAKAQAAYDARQSQSLRGPISCGATRRA